MSNSNPLPQVSTASDNADGTLHSNPSQGVSSTPSPTTDDMGTLIMGPVIAIAILVTVIIIGTVIFMILMCYTVQRRLSLKSSAAEAKDKCRMSTMSQIGFPVCRNPSYSSATLNTYRGVSGRSTNRAVSEHLYESCYDPYEYMNPAIELEPAVKCSSGPRKSRLSSSDIYEIPFGTLPACYRPPPTLNHTSHTLPSRPVYNDGNGAVNNLYVATVNGWQPSATPLSPGYEAPMCHVEGRQQGLEESAIYKEPGWVYQG